MPAAVRLGDSCTGHGPFPPRANDSASSNVFINGRGAHRIGDHWVMHCDPLPSCHDGSAATGSSSVFVNGRALCRVGDQVSCGSAMASGSPNVFVNG
jgi:uncharacterized Zn-binding protein involved in type VI secretion